MKLHLVDSIVARGLPKSRAVAVFFGGLILAAQAAQTTVQEQRATSQSPNFLFIIAEDCTYTDMEVYGGQAKTPNMVRLASEGMTFNRCFQAAPMCSPTRHCIYTGL
jgi:N-sulfoglucosamine sulfohydrolase